MNRVCRTMAEPWLETRFIASLPFLCVVQKQQLAIVMAGKEPFTAF
jgi:hypothetical protein